jgi:hypothetical protein
VLHTVGGGAVAHGAGRLARVAESPHPRHEVVADLDVRGALDVLHRQAAVADEVTLVRLDHPEAEEDKLGKEAN